MRIELSSPPIDAGTVSYAEVAVDAESYEPLRFRYRSGDEKSYWWRVVSIETLAREEGQFAPPKQAEPRPRRQTGSDDERALRLPKQPPRWIARPSGRGGMFAGIQLTEIELVKLTTEWTDNRETVSRALVLQYGPRRHEADGEPWLMATQTTSRAENLRFGAFTPGAQPGELELQTKELMLVGAGDLDGSPVDMWFGSMVVDGVYRRARIAAAGGDPGGCARDGADRVAGRGRSRRSSRKRPPM